MDHSLVKQKQMVSDQAKRFAETARELGCDESEERFNENLKRIAKSKSNAAKERSDNDTP